MPRRPRPDGIGQFGTGCAKDVPRNGHGEGKPRYALRYESASTGTTPHAFAPVLSAGNWPISVNPVFEVLHHGTFVRARQISGFQPADMDVRLRQHVR